MPPGAYCASPSLGCSIFPALNLLESLSTLRPIGLEEVAGAALLDRLDHKLIVSERWLPEILAYCHATEGEKDGGYRILEVNGQRQSRYDNVFYDSPDFHAFNDHVRGRKVRHKARIRSYGSNGQTFVEVKRKTVHGRTVKDRIVRRSDAAWDAPLTAQESEFMRLHFPYADRSGAVMRSKFNRFTLVHSARGERITVDTDLVYGRPEHAIDDPEAAPMLRRVSGIAVMEIKQVRIDRQSPIYRIVDHFLGAHPPLGRPTRLSKYILGTGLMHPQLPLRTYLPVFRDIQRSLNP